MSADDFDAKLAQISELFQSGLILEDEFKARLLQLEQESGQPAASVASDSAVQNTPSDATAAPEAQPTPAKRSSRSYAPYIYNVLKQVHPDTGISRNAMSIVDSFVQDIFERIASEAGNLARYNMKKTITAREIQTAVRLLLPGELATHAVSEGSKAVSKYSAITEQAREDVDKDESEPDTDEEEQEIPLENDDDE
eukprot:TRINITY_DN16127_c0_g1_i1.p1 TRINITY_DN16127_c0_g1~~TRINITY_DN16127_c0_g1_i1.p1  ORF type:complete len:196 (-),score=41.68 TRINITY_DN16127_c0_g1_i1:51-638(-)